MDRAKEKPGWRGGNEKNWQWRTLYVSVGPVFVRCGLVLP
jgi:hypothetical protein